MPQLSSTLTLPTTTDTPPALCRRTGCGRPEVLHCPDCGTCWPDHTCSILCDADTVDRAVVAELVDQWDDADLDRRDEIVAEAELIASSYR